MENAKKIPSRSTRVRAFPHEKRGHHPSATLRPRALCVVFSALAASAALLPSPVLGKQGPIIRSTEGAPWTAPPRKIAIRWNDPYELFQIGFEEMTDEVGAIFAPLGVRFEWERASAMTLTRRPNTLLVLLLPDKPSSWPLSAHTMGVVTHGKGLIRVFFNEVAHTLGYRAIPVREGAQKRRALDMGRALARVLAHEIIHAVAPPHPHADRGLMNHMLNRGDLIKGSSPPLDAGCTSAFLACLRSPHARSFTAAQLLK